MRVILASASPRRRELLGQLFAEFEIIPAKGDEAYTKCRPSEIVQELSIQKAAEIERELYPEDSPMPPDYLIIGADTVVAFEGKILGKPKDAPCAKEMLQMLAGNMHQVYTGVALFFAINGKRRHMEFTECTNVQFYPMEETEIEAYVHSGEPMDKAGGYGIQGFGGRFVQGIEGDYQNVVGLPVARLYQVLKKIDEIALPFCGSSTMIDSGRSIWA